MREFNIKLNTAILEDTRSNQRENYCDERITESVRLCDSIMEIFKKNNTDMETAYMILSALADAVYVTAVYGEELL